jgi:hypothetical protein
MKKASLLIFAILFALSAFAADSQTVSYKNGDETVQGPHRTSAGTACSGTWEFSPPSCFCRSPCVRWNSKART